MSEGPSHEHDADGGCGCWPRERRRRRRRRFHGVQSSQDMLDPDRESRTTPHRFTMYIWGTILSVCITLWMLQRLIRAWWKGNSISNEGGGDHFEIKPARKRSEESVPLIGAGESKPHQYDVFINHRGPDVKQTFVAHLDAALRRNGFRPFLDAKDIGQGRHVFNSIDRALKGACVHVAIFSRRYAESKYCLNELCEMLRSGKDILPVFYHVNPEDLRRVEEGPFKEGFQKHVERGRMEQIPKWKEALLKIADFRGFRLDEVNGNEELLIRSILVEVRRLMPVDVLPGKQRYGLVQSMKDVLKTLESVSVVGLVGMGGIGKTTLAEEVYNHLVRRRQFERYCFLKDVRSNEQFQLQRKLLSDMGQQSELQSTSSQDYRRVVEALLCERVLVVVDDIDHSSQFAALIPEIQMVGCGSRVVITSRDCDVLERAMARAASKEVYEVQPLSKMDSRHLFNWHAFLSEAPDEGFGDLAVQVADACGGHALSLEVIGASLFGKTETEDREIWTEAVRALQENKEVFDKLRSSYDRLPSDGDRAMFVDIACMMIGVEKEVALTVWKSCNSPMHRCSTSRTPALVLRRLIDRSLVKVDKFGYLGMHDVLRDMGRDIVKREGRGLEEQTHLWDAGSAMKVLSCGKENAIIRGINLAGVGNKAWRRQSVGVGAVSCAMHGLAGMKELHFLRLDGCNVLVPSNSSNWPQELRWLRCRHSPFAQLPSQLNQISLVVLDLWGSGNLTRLWENDAHIQLPLLETLDLSRCHNLEELAENVGQSLPKLKRLLMSWCNNLRRLPESIGLLTDLEDLNLSFCEKLLKLPDGIVRLISLRQLSLSWCDERQKLPEELGKLTNLVSLDLSWCEALCELPASIGGLKILKTLKLEDSKVLDLPGDFGLLTSLTELSLPSLCSFPNSFQGLQALSSLSVDGGSADLGDLGALTALKDLKLMRHTMLTILPKSLGNLKWLVRLKILCCKELLAVEVLPEGLEHLDLRGCDKLIEIPSLGAMRFLVYLNLINCSSLKYVHGLGCLSALEYINLSGCTSMEGCAIQLSEHRYLRECDLRGSKVGLAYNNRWLEREPKMQVISWLGDAIPVLSNGMENQVVVSYREWSLVLEASISIKGECLALLWCMVHQSDDVSMRIQVWRGGRLVVEDESSLYFYSGDVVLRNDGHDSVVSLWTLRREHGIVQSLEYRDQVHIYVTGSIVVEGAICVVQDEDGRLAFQMNSEVLSKSESEDLARQFGQLVLGGYGFGKWFPRCI